MPAKTQKPDVIQKGYYQLPNKQIVQVLLRASISAGTRVPCKTELGKYVEMRRKTILSGNKINYRPTHKQLWELSKKLPKQKLDKEEGRKITKEFKDEMFFCARIRFFFQKLIEFDRVKINTLGYYYKDKEANKESIGESIAYQTGMSYGWVGRPSHKVRADLANGRNEFEAWIENPNPKTAKAFFRHISPFSIDRECPVTNERFEWSFNGTTFKPAYKILNVRERTERNKELSQERKILKRKKSLSENETKRLTLLDDAFTQEFGWMKYYDLFHLAPVIPFKDKFADPKTGEFPRSIVQICVPTGKLVFANSLFDYIKDMDPQKARQNGDSINGRRGRQARTDWHAKENNTFYLSVGNSSPRVYQSHKDPSKLKVGAPRDEAEKGEWSYPAANRFGKEQGYITTGLWAFMATDRSNLPKELDVTHFIVDLPPGIYQLTSYIEDEDENGIFCDITKVKDIPKNKA